MSMEAEDRMYLANLIKNIVLRRTNLQFAWGIAHKPELRALLINRPFEILKESETWDDDPELWQSSIVLAIMYIGREREIGNLLPEPPEEMTAEEFIMSCYN